MNNSTFVAYNSSICTEVYLAFIPDGHFLVSARLAGEDLADILIYLTLSVLDILRSEGECGGVF